MKIPIISTKSLLSLIIGLTIFNVAAAPIAQAASNFDKKAAVGPWEYWDDTDYSSLIPTDCSNGSGVAVTGDNVKDAFIFLTGKGLKDYQAAGIIGNLQQESTIRLDPTIQQDGSHDPMPKNKVGFGIAQWTYTDRQQPLVDLAKKMNKPPSDLGVQLTYLWQELNTTHKTSLTAVRATNDATSAAVAFAINFEGCAHCGSESQIRNDPIERHRITNAQEVLQLAQNRGWSGASAPSTGASSSLGGCTSSGSASGSRIVQIALTEVGVSEQPPGSNRGPACKYQSDSGGPCPGEAWCADFVSWVYQHAGAPFTGGAGKNGWRIAAAESVMNWFKANGTWIDNPGSPMPASDPRAPKPGDVVFYPAGQGHVNIVVSYDGKTVITVGGNQGAGAVTSGTRDNFFGTAAGWGRLKQ